MTSKLRAVAETRFAALIRREDVALTSVEEKERTVREKTARLRALRLAKEAQTTLDRTLRLEAKRRAKASV